MKSYDIGLAGEESAALFLEKSGYTVKGRRVRVGRSEIDIIAEDENYIIFAEVKTRRVSPDETISPAAAVDEKKQGYLIRGTEEYLLTNKTEKFVRIDIIEVLVSAEGDGYTPLEIRHIKNAVKRNGKFSLKESRKKHY